VKLLEHQLLRRLARRHQVLRLRERKVEQQQEVPPGADRHLAAQRNGGHSIGDRRHHRGLGQIDDLEADDLLVIAPVEQQAVLDAQAENRLAVDQHVDRHLDHRNVRRFGERLGRGRHQPGDRSQQGHQGEHDVSSRVGHGLTLQSITGRRAPGSGA
jgi:hypothetical protein